MVWVFRFRFVQTECVSLSDHPSERTVHFSPALVLEERLGGRQSRPSFVSPSRHVSTYAIPGVWQVLARNYQQTLSSKLPICVVCSALSDGISHKPLRPAPPPFPLRPQWYPSILVIPPPPPRGTAWALSFHVEWLGAWVEASFQFVHVIIPPPPVERLGS